MEAVLRVFPHREGPWLVRAGPVVLGVPAGIGTRLRPLDGKRPTPSELRRVLEPHDRGGALAERLSGGMARRPFSWRRFWAERFPVWVRIPLVPAAAVAVAARRCGKWARPWALLGLGLAGAAGVLAPGGGTAASSVSTLGLVIGVVLLVASALWHELGHAAALQEAGYRPGGLGLGMLAVVPVFFVDVTPVALLPRRRRLLINAAGPVFQIALAAVYRLLSVLPVPPDLAMGLRIAAVSATLAVSWSLWPFVRSDGYWLLCDALDIPRLDRPLPLDRGRTTRLLAAALRVLNVLFLLSVGVFLTLAAHRRWGLEIRPPRLDASLAATVAGLILWATIAARSLLLIRLAVRDLRVLETRMIHEGATADG